MIFVTKMTAARSIHARQSPYPQATGSSVAHVPLSTVGFGGFGGSRSKEFFANHLPPACDIGVSHHGAYVSGHLAKRKHRRESWGTLYPFETARMDPDQPHEDVPYDTALVSELLKAKRKSRGIKSCFPCRHRKVRCDGGIPCSNCVRRDHASLCRTAVSSPTPSTSSTQSAQSIRHSAPSIDLLMNPITSESYKPHLARAEYYQGSSFAPQRHVLPFKVVNCR